MTPYGVPGEFMSPDRYDQSNQCRLGGVNAVLFLSLLPFMSNVHWGLSFFLLFPGILLWFFFFFEVSSSAIQRQFLSMKWD